MNTDDRIEGALLLAWLVGCLAGCIIGDAFVDVVQQIVWLLS